MIHLELLKRSSDIKFLETHPPKILGVNTTPSSQWGLPPSLTHADSIVRRQVLNASRVTTDLHRSAPGKIGSSLWSLVNGVKVVIES